MVNIFAIIAVAAIGSLIAAEVLVAYQKHQMKKQFLEDMDQKNKDV
jgi:hypothetical protein